MTELTIGDHRYRLIAFERDRQWFARAERVDTGDPYGEEWSGATEAEATERLACWLDWQHEHAAALHALQQAERAYQRTLAGAAFVNPTEGPMPIEMQKEALQDLEAARLRLDEVRARRP
jgi:hypothetical protein